MGEHPSSPANSEVLDPARDERARVGPSGAARRPAASRALALSVWLLLTVLVGAGALAVHPGHAPAPRLGMSVYGLVVVSYLVLQTIFAHLYFIGHRHASRKRRTESVSVVIPTYNEDPTVVARTVRSLLAQDYDGPIQVVVVDDGSRPDCSPARVLTTLPVGKRRSLEVVRFGTNKGKRHAHYEGFGRARGDFVITVDSDTELGKEAVNALVDEMLHRPRAGALTGNLRVSNATNLFTRLLDIRFWSSFNQERAAQSLFGVMICCSGAIAMYRREFLMQVRDVYIGQRFLGRPCTYGDDRHLTNLALWHGYEAAFVPDAHGLTACPTQVRRWVRQQLRWSKSFCREMLWSVRLMHRRNWYFAYSLTLGAALPFALLWGLGWGVAHIVAGEWALAARYLLAIVFMAMLRGGYGLYRTGEWVFMLAPLYGLMHLAFVLPVRIVAPLALLDTRWGTR